MPGGVPRNHERCPPWHKIVPQAKFCGIEILKNPSDLWVMQEILWECKPHTLIETGTHMGGSALYWAHHMDRIGRGKVISIDIKSRDDLPYHDRIQYIVGDSAKVEIPVSGLVCAFLDSNHSKEHVLNELDHIGPLVSSGQMLVVEDSAIGLGGPLDAIHEWFPEHPEFVNEPKWERYHYTYNVEGFWRKR